MKLEPGAWERLVTRGLAASLDAARDLVTEIVRIDPAEAPIRVTQYLAPLVERTLRSIPESDSGARIAVANALLTLLRDAAPRTLESSDDQVDEPARMLYSVYPQSAFGTGARPNRPTIPLSDTALLTNATDEPAIGREIQLELETADDVDLLCAFVRFEGVRILEDQLRALVERGGKIRVVTTTYLQSTERRAVDMLIDLGAQVKIAYELEATRLHAKAWLFKHPSPWDYMFFMSNALKAKAPELGWFWYYWLFTTESVDGSIQSVVTSGRTTSVTVRQDGQMPSPVVLKVQFAPTGPAIRPMANARMLDSVTAIVTWPVDVWFAGSRTFRADLTFGQRKIERVVLDPFCRFPDRDPSDNVWPKGSGLPPGTPAPAPGGQGGGGGRGAAGAPTCG